MEISVAQRLSGAIAGRRDMFVEITQALVRRPSVGSEREAQDYLIDWCAARGLSPDVWEPDLAAMRSHPACVPVDCDYDGRPNVVAMIAGAGGGRSLTLNGHMDVVPVDAPDAWSHGGPWAGSLVDGRIYGRGAVDMKGGIAVAMILIDALAACGIRLLGDLQLQSVVDEECGGNGTLAAILRGYRSDATIFLEPTGPNLLVVSGRGAQFFRITVPGAEAGIEYQGMVPNAVEKAATVIRAVENYAERRKARVAHPLYAFYPTQSPVAVCAMHGGNWPSTFPAQCVLEGSVECMPGEDIDAVREEFRAHVLELASRDSWLAQNPPQIEWFGLRLEAGETPADDPLVQGIRAAAGEVLGETPQVVGGGGSDLRLTVRYAQSPSVLYGPSGGMIHGTDEYVVVESAVQTAQVLGRFIMDWCGTA